MMHIVATPLQSVSVVVLLEPMVGGCPLNSWGRFRNINFLCLSCFYPQNLIWFLPACFHICGVSRSLCGYVVFDGDCLWWAWWWEVGMWLSQFYVAIPFTILPPVTTSSHFVSHDFIFITFVCVFLPDRHSWLPCIRWLDNVLTTDHCIMSKVTFASTLCEHLWRSCCLPDHCSYRNLIGFHAVSAITHA